MNRGDLTRADAAEVQRLLDLHRDGPRTKSDALVRRADATEIQRLLDLHRADGREPRPEPSPALMRHLIPGTKRVA
ncbi:MAG: hypothetical protein AB7I08_12290 [Thermoleophilia bacterium]